MSVYAGFECCDWCAADYYANGRCQRCGQPEQPCNEVAGRSFRMTWDMRSRHFETGWEDHAYPRMPATRVVTAIRLMRVNSIVLAMSVAYMRHAMPVITGYPSSVLFGRPPTALEGTAATSLGYAADEIP